jgi:hypothetical protein
LPRRRCRLRVVGRPRPRPGRWWAPGRGRCRRLRFGGSVRVAVVLAAARLGAPDGLAQASASPAFVLPRLLVGASRSRVLLRRRVRPPLGGGCSRGAHRGTPMHLQRRSPAASLTGSLPGTGPWPATAPGRRDAAVLVKQPRFLWTSSRMSQECTGSRSRLAGDVSRRCGLVAAFPCRNGPRPCCRHDKDCGRADAWILAQGEVAAARGRREHPSHAPLVLQCCAGFSPSSLRLLRLLARSSRPVRSTFVRAFVGVAGGWLLGCFRDSGFRFSVALIVLPFDPALALVPAPAVKEPRPT